MHTVLCIRVFSTQSTYRVNTDNCFLWYVRAVLESIFSTQYSKAYWVLSTNSTENRFPRWQHRALRGSRDSRLLPAGRSYTNRWETSPQACSPHCVLCGSMQTFRSFNQQTSPCSFLQTKPSPLYIPGLPLGVWNHCRSQQTAPSANTAGPIMLSRALRTCIVVCMHLYSRLYIVKWICTKKLSFIAGTAFRL